MVAVETILVKLASRCNLDCDYCYIYRMADDGWRDQPKRMSIQTASVLAERLAVLQRAQGRPFSVVFHGGEPLLIGARRFDEICAVLRRTLPPGCDLALQTNGVLLDEAVIAACIRHDVSVSISLDGPAAVHDRHRPTHRGAGSHAAVVAGIARLTATPAGRRLFSGVLAVVDLAEDPIAVYAALKATGAPSIDFLYRDGHHDTLPAGKVTAADDAYGRWAVRLLDHYLADQHPTPVRVLDDMLRILLGGRAIKEGVGTEAFGILVIETDGTIAKNDTLKGSHRGADRFEHPPSVHRDALIDVIADPAYVAYEATQAPTALACQECPDLRACGGGMPAHRWSAAHGFDNPTVFCVDQKTLIARMRHHLRQQEAAA